MPSDLKTIKKQETKVSKHGTLLLTACYWSLPIGYGPFLPIVAAWVFRRNRFLCHQLTQSALLQGFLFLFILCLRFNNLFQILSSYRQADVQSMLASGLSELLIGISVWLCNLVLIGFSLHVFSKGSVNIPIIGDLADKLLSWLSVKRVKRALALNLCLPGLGHLYLGRTWLAAILFSWFALTLAGLCFLLLAKWDYAFAKDLLTHFRFYLRIDDATFSNAFVNWIAIGILFLLLLTIYVLSVFTILPKLGFNEESRRFSGSLAASAALHMAALFVLLLVPYLMVEGEMKKDIEERAQEIHKKLEQQQKERYLNELRESYDPETQESGQEHLERSFDLQLTPNIEKLNEFSDKPFSHDSNAERERPKIGLGDRKDELPDPETYASERTRKTKSYSEYITAKIREGERDKLLWERVDVPYSMVIEYVVEPDGRISSIEVLQHSQNLEWDALGIAAVESMSPMVPPPGGERLRITELFWNTVNYGLPTEMQQKLASYPDGRLIETIE